MLLFMDSSSIVALYVGEPGSMAAHNAFGGADSAVCSLVAYAEVRAAFARLQREGRISRGVFGSLTRSFEAGWSS